MTRKHKGIIQEGCNKGRLKKGFFYSGERTKAGLPMIKEKKYLQEGGTLVINSIKLAKPVVSSLTKGALRATRSKGPSKALRDIRSKGASRARSSKGASRARSSKGFFGPSSSKGTTLAAAGLASALAAGRSIAETTTVRNITNMPSMFNISRITSMPSKLQTVFSDIKTHSVESDVKVLLDQIIEELIKPIDEVNISDLDTKLDTIVILRIIIKVTRNLIKNFIEDKVKTDLNDELDTAMKTELQKVQLLDNLGKHPINSYKFNIPSKLYKNLKLYKVKGTFIENSNIILDNYNTKLRSYPI